MYSLGTATHLLLLHLGLQQPLLTRHNMALFSICLFRGTWNAWYFKLTITRLSHAVYTSVILVLIYREREIKEHSSYAACFHGKSAEILQVQVQPYGKVHRVSASHLGSAHNLFREQSNLLEFVNTLLRFIWNSSVAEHSRSDIGITSHGTMMVGLNKQCAMVTEVNIFIR